VQSLRIERLDEMHMKARLETADTVFVPPMPSYRNQERGGCSRLLPQPARNLMTVHLRHLDVEQHYIRLIVASGFQGSSPVMGDSGLVAPKFDEQS
jgi:hypothetical protein